MRTEEIRSRIRQMLETGDLPCEEPEKTWAGNGGGDHCAACGEAIRRDEVEFEVDLKSGWTLRLHRGCHDIWIDECHKILQ
jgi:hypothetical protein